jgi:hypothetical protein
VTHPGAAWSLDGATIAPAANAPDSTVSFVHHATDAVVRMLRRPVPATCPLPSALAPLLNAAVAVAVRPQNVDAAASARLLHVVWVVVMRAAAGDAAASAWACGGCVTDGLVRAGATFCGARLLQRTLLSADEPLLSFRACGDQAAAAASAAAGLVSVAFSRCRGLSWSWRGAQPRMRLRVTGATLGATLCALVAASRMCATVGKLCLK